jgi:hypothetical protein
VNDPFAGGNILPGNFHFARQSELVRTFHKNTARQLGDDIDQPATCADFDAPTRGLLAPRRRPVFSEM